MKKALAILFLLQASSSIFGASLNLSSEPLFYSSTPVPPIVMLDMSRDHQLTYKAYTDYADLDGDGIPDTTYKNSIDYYGYFDSYKCYTYDSSVNYFKPAVTTTDKYCNAGSTSGQWSGNFLNWVTMSRMDVVRKLLYGGYRSTDTGTLTILERSFVPSDAHAWAKYYNGSDIAKLTPFALTSYSGSYPYPSGTSTKSIKLDGTNPGNILISYSAAGGVQLGDQLWFVSTSNANNTLQGAVKSCTQKSDKSCDTSQYITISLNSRTNVSPSPYGYTGSGTYNSWTVYNLSRTGISFCNVTKGDSTNHSESNKNPPLLRVVQGDYALWSANEVWQCQWMSEKSNTQSSFSGVGSNGNIAAATGLLASAENPSQPAVGLGTGIGQGEYYARVSACVSGLINQEKCKQYPNGNYKPIGLLQSYGDSDLIQFGLFTGSYNKNLSGGVLRKNVGSFTNEVNISTDGTFKSPPSNGGIVNALNIIRQAGFDYSNGNHYGSYDNCSYQLTSITEGQCRGWGNPTSEIYLESLRYLAGKSATPAFVADDSSFITWASPNKLLTSSWSDPLSAANYCARLNVIDFNASVSSYDSDQLAGTSDIGTSITANSLTNNVGSLEGVAGSYFIGDNGAAVSDGLCSPKSVSYLGTISGLCPEAPTQKGSFNIAGLAYYAHTNDIRPSLTGNQTVNTYGVALATNVPKVQVSGTNFILMPAYRLVVNNTYGTGGLVDFKIVCQDNYYTPPGSNTPLCSGAGTGAFYVNWDDSNQGGDYDQDVYGIIKYSKNGSGLTVSTQAVSYSTTNPQGFGYVIGGSTKDGVHFHSGILGFNYVDPTGVTGCTNCNAGPLTTVNYAAGNASVKQFNDPLWYAAKYGGFDNSTNAGRPLNSPNNWDIKKADGTSGSDGVPDNYFYAVNPAQLENSLNQAFQSVLTTGQAAAIASNSVVLQTTTKAYEATFDTQYWSGALYSYPIQANGNISTTPDWNAAQQIPTNQTSRAILSYDGATGIPLRFDSLSAAQQLALNTNVTTGTTDSQGSARLNYLRGDRTNEGTGTGKFRVRSAVNGLLGDIIDSTPVYVGAPAANYPQGLESVSYSDFANANATRTPVVYVGANDGMLHAFKAADGSEMFAYMPGVLLSSQAPLPNVNRLPAQNYSHSYFVDGSPVIGDVVFGGTWHTVLIGSLRGGGRGLFALDVTSPDSITESSVSKVLWEFTNTQDADLGYTYAQPVIARMANGKWGVIVGNGYNSTGTGKPVLFVLDIQTGAVIKKITATGASNTVANGLSSPFVLDADGDGIADYAYAGDLTGNIWKFDFTSTNSDSWGISFSGQPLYQATDGNNNPQPITARPLVTFAQTSSGIVKPGYMVVVGTGKLLETGDNNSTSNQTIYGIYDTNTKANPNNAAFTGRSLLRKLYVAQTNTVNYEGATYPNRVICPQGMTSVNGACSGAAITSCDGTGYRGWYFDLPGLSGSTTGERVFNNAIIAGYNVAVPSSIPSNASCEYGGTSFINGLDASCGVNSNQISWQVAGIVSQGAVIGNYAYFVSTGSGAITGGGSGSGAIKTPVSPGVGGQVGWRELFH